MRVLRGEQEVDENNLRLPDLDEEDEDEEEEDEDDLDGDDFGDQGPRGGGGMVGGMGQRRPGGLSADGGGRRVSTENGREALCVLCKGIVKWLVASVNSRIGLSAEIVLCRHSNLISFVSALFLSAGPGFTGQL